MKKEMERKTSWDGKTERRLRKEPRRRLVDLTLKPGTDRRVGQKDRRKGAPHRGPGT